MAAAPKWKVYSPDVEYVASCKHAEDAACLVALYGDGATIRFEHYRFVWSEGEEDQPAQDSYDFVAEVCQKRVAELRRRTVCSIKGIAGARRLCQVHNFDYQI